jgi:hypothetical protein
VNSNYKRVNRHRTCLICGKPDWCSYTPDAKISFCARISQGADRVSHTGWGVFYHEQSLFGNSPIPCPSKPPTKKVELAPIEIRDFAYRKLIELSPATQSPTTIDGPKGLRARKIFNFHDYGSLSTKQNERNSLAKIIRLAINREFPEFVKYRKSALSGLPGFWIDKNGNSRLWIENDCANPMLLIPYCDEAGFIQACQIRFFGNIYKKSPRYVWLSTPVKSAGVGSGSPLHFVSYCPSPDKKPLIITEGALKAATTHLFKPQFDILANAGVTSSHSHLIEAAKFRPIFIAFDVDYFENYFVAFSLAKLINNLTFYSPKYCSNQISIFTWNPKFRGIDDALLNQSSVISVNVREWFLSLSRDFQSKIFNCPDLSFFRSHLN